MSFRRRMCYLASGLIAGVPRMHGGARWHTPGVPRGVEVVPLVSYVEASGWWHCSCSLKPLSPRDLMAKEELAAVGFADDQVVVPPASSAVGAEGAERRAYSDVGAPQWRYVGLASAAREVIAGLRSAAKKKATLFGW